VQLQTQGVPRLIAPEARIAFDWSTQTERFADGETVELRAPVVRIEDLAYGPLGDGVMISARVAPPVIGMGLLDAVPEDAILALAARTVPEGIRGRPNRVWDVEGKRFALGRFGLKATTRRCASRWRRPYRGHRPVHWLFPSRTARARSNTAAR
jgi:CxxC motif-containing protein (DUF1111 family)